MTIKLPFSKEAEQVVIGRLLNSVNVCNSVFECLEETDFFDPEHRKIFRAAKQLFLQDHVVDASAVFIQMEKECGVADRAVFGLATYYGAMDISIQQYIDAIRSYSVARKTIGFCREMISESIKPNVSADGIRSKFLSDSEEIFKMENEGKVRSLNEVIENNFKDSNLSFLEYVEQKQEERARGLNPIEGYLTGYRLLDDCLEGINKKHYIIIGARAGIGKTTFLLNLMKRMTERNLKVGFFSLEMSADMIVEKYLCLSAQVSQKRLARKELSPDDFQCLVNASKNIGDSIYIDDQPNLYLSQLTARAKRMVKANGVKVIFIDYLSEIKGEGRFTSKQEEIQHVSKGVRALAKSLNIPIICLAQLNRENEKADRRPRKSDLRESGQIEADAYSIMMLHRDEEKRPGVLEVHVVKNRLGNESSFDFNFNGDSGEISEIGYYKMANREKEEQIKGGFYNDRCT